MNHEDKTATKLTDIAAKGTAGAATAGGLAFSASVLHTQGMAGAAAALGPLVTLLGAWGVDKLITRYSTRHDRGYVANFPSPEAAQEHRQQHRDDENHQATMFQSFKQMMDVTDETVIETLGYLAGQYAIAGRKPDGFFRSLGRVLCDLEEGELDQLKTLLNRLEESERREYVVCATLAHHGEVQIGDDPGNSFRLPSAKKLGHLLRREGFVIDGPEESDKKDGIFGFKDGLTFELEVVHRLLGTIDPQPSNA